MYVPKHQYKKVKTSEIPGKLVDNLGNLFPGLSAILTSFGSYFDVPKEDLEKGNFDNATELFEVKESDLKKASSFIPKNIDYSRKTLKRSFLLNKVNGNLKEISPDDKTINNPLYETKKTIEWEIQGPVEDTFFKGKLLEGAKTKNQRTINKTEKILPGISILLDPTEFVKEVDTTGTSKDPVKEKDQFYIPAPSKSLRK